MFDVIKKMQCTICKMIALIDALKKYFQNALDKNLSTDRLQLTKKFKSTKETPKFKICTFQMR